ncbi:HmuY family protein [Mariniflexile sp.]|uniref:HmuY family protein n=1 Tax=Mariniflexile sp. TaxID=1979402 RepID=UPI00404763C1
MKTIQLVTLVTLFIGFTSCNSDDNTTPLLEVESQNISNLYAPQEGGQGQPVSGQFAKFDFATGQTTTSGTEWDIAFRGTTIIVNGGVSLGTTDEPERTGNAAAYIANGTMASITDVDASLFTQDSNTGYAIASGSGNGWYLYDSQANLITPIAGKILVFKTRNGNYAKVEILSYYKDAPSNPKVAVDEGRYFTFNYVYQPNEGVITF